MDLLAKLQTMCYLGIPFTKWEDIMDGKHMFNCGCGWESECRFNRKITHVTTIKYENKGKQLGDPGVIWYAGHVWLGQCQGSYKQNCEFGFTIREGEKDGN